jgi:hypothetical protein
MYEMQGASLGRTEQLADCPGEPGPPGQSAIRTQSVLPPVQNTCEKSGCPFLTPPGKAPVVQCQSSGQPVPARLQTLGFPVLRLPLSCLWAEPFVASGWYPFSLVGKFYATKSASTRPSDRLFQDSFPIHRAIHRNPSVVHRTARYPLPHPQVTPQPYAQVLRRALPPNDARLPLSP